MNLRDHSFYMQLALKEAQKAAQRNEVPIGAIIIGPEGDLIAKGFNQVEKRHSQAAHAEHIAIQKAGRVLGDWRLLHCTIYITLEPCAMCMNLIVLSRIPMVVYGASSLKFGFCLDKEGLVSLYRRNTVTIIPGVQADQSEALLQRFFSSRRKASE